MDDGKLYVHAVNNGIPDGVGCISTLITVVLFKCRKYDDPPTIDIIEDKYDWQKYAVYPRALFKHTFSHPAGDWEKVKGGWENRCEVQVFLYFKHTPPSYFKANRRYHLIFGVGPLSPAKYLTVPYTNSDGDKGLRFLHQANSSIQFQMVVGDLTTIDLERFNVPVLLLAP
jgi:hypothetical protein